MIGLRATGSDSFTASDLFVPREHSAARDDPAERRHGGPLYCFPTTSLYASGFAGVALGNARSALDAFVALAQAKTPRGLRQPLRESAVVQSELARTEARVGAARALLLGSLEEVWRGVVETGTLGLDQRVRIRMAATHAITEATAAVDFAYHTAGATAIFDAHPFERRFRDAHTRRPAGAGPPDALRDGGARPPRARARHDGVSLSRAERARQVPGSRPARASELQQAFC